MVVRPLAFPDNLLVLWFQHDAATGRFVGEPGREIHLRWNSPELPDAKATVTVGGRTIGATAISVLPYEGLRADFSAEDFAGMPLYPVPTFVQVGGASVRLGAYQLRVLAQFVGHVSVAFELGLGGRSAVAATENQTTQPSSQEHAPLPGSATSEATNDELKDPFEESKEPDSAPTHETEGAVAEPGEYHREDWRHWIDEDSDCQDTRTEVLITESTKPVIFTDDHQCRVKRGRWVCPYTGKVFTNPNDLDIDHFVALGNAGRSGGNGWSADDKAKYANDLDHDDHLVAVFKSANRSKSDKGPEEWLPARAAYRCEYVKTWVTIKARWKLELSDRERSAIKGYLDTCVTGGTIAVRAAPKPRRATTSHEAKPRPASTTKTWKPSARTCCKVCRSGCPCGDSCISCNKRCRKGPGCAC